MVIAFLLLFILLILLENRECLKDEANDQRFLPLLCVCTLQMLLGFRDFEAANVDR